MSDQEYYKTYYKKNREKLQTYFREWHRKHRKEHPEVYKKWNQQGKMQRKQRVFENKKRAVELSGGKCIQCGYHKNLAALEFHHPDGREKDDIDLYDAFLRILTNEKILELIKGKILLCSNCHSEIHHPDSNLETGQ